MVEGDKWELYIPSNLAYGDNGRVAGCLVFTMVSPSWFTISLFFVRRQ